MKQLLTLLKFPLYTVTDILANLLAFPLVPIAVLLADSEGRLPKALRWLETPDALGWGAGYYETFIKGIYDSFGKHAGMIMWLWRNRAYSLSAKWQATPNYSTMVMRSYGTPGVFKNAPAWWVGTIADGNRWWFEFSFAIRVGNLFSIGMRTGWKLLPFFDGSRPEDFTKTATGIFTGVTLRTDSVDGA